MAQFLPQSSVRARMSDLHPGDVPEGMELQTIPEDDAWVEGQALISTVEDVELIDPALSSERLVYRLFHEAGVRVMPSVKLSAECFCSREHVQSMLKSFSQDDRDHMVEEGKVAVTCEFCSTTYLFSPDEINARA